MKAKRQHKVLIGTARYAGRKVVVNAFFKSIQNGHAQCSGQMNFDLLNRVLRA